MTLTIRDIALGFAFLLAFPLAIHLTDWAASGQSDLGRPPATAQDGSHSG